MGHTPLPGELVQFGGDGSSNSDCYGLTANRFTVEMLGPEDTSSPYTSAVTFTGSAAPMYALVLKSGTVIQQGVDLSVSTGCVWNGGALNPDGDGSTQFHILPGASATIDPSLHALLTGDTLSFECSYYTSSQSFIEGGTLTFNKGAGAVIGGVVAGGTGRASVTVEGSVDGFLGVQNLDLPDRPEIKVNPTGRITFTGPGARTSYLPMQVVGGTAIIQTRATVTFSGDKTFFGNLGPDKIKANVMMSSGLIALEDDSTLAATNGIYLSGGKFSTLPAGSNVAIVDTPKFYDNGADVVINDTFAPPGGPHTAGTLRCTGEVTFSAGTFRPVIDVAANTCDLWKSDKDFTVNAGAKFAPGTINGVPQQGLTYKFLEAANQIIGTPPAVDSLVITYTIVKDVPGKIWYFRKS